MSSIAAIRKDYIMHTLSEKECAEEPIAQFSIWWQEAINSQIDEINAMTLATASIDGVPSARIVLLKEYDQQGFVFYTNYKSFKGQELLSNPRACLIFFWKELERQVRITGVVEKVSANESDAYFYSRPEGSRIGAWTSPQSQVIPNRDWLEEREREIVKQYEGIAIPRPEHWGGYRVRPVQIEFWQGRASRLHDRILYTLEDGSWKIERLAP